MTFQGGGDAGPVISDAPPVNQEAGQAGPAAVDGFNAMGAGNWVGPNGGSDQTNPPGEGGTDSDGSKTNTDASGRSGLEPGGQGDADSSGEKPEGKKPDGDSGDSEGGDQVDNPPDAPGKLEPGGFEHPESGVPDMDRGGSVTDSNGLDSLQNGPQSAEHGREANTDQSDTNKSNQETNRESENSEKNGQDNQGDEVDSGEDQSETSGDKGDSSKDRQETEGDGADSEKSNPESELSTNGDGSDKESPSHSRSPDWLDNLKSPGMLKELPLPDYSLPDTLARGIAQMPGGAKPSSGESSMQPWDQVHKEITRIITEWNSQVFKPASYKDRLAGDPANSWMGRYGLL